MPERSANESKHGLQAALGSPRPFARVSRTCEISCRQHSRASTLGMRKRFLRPTRCCFALPPGSSRAGRRIECRRDVQTQSDCTQQRPRAQGRAYATSELAGRQSCELHLSMGCAPRSSTRTRALPPPVANLARSTTATGSGAPAVPVMSGTGPRQQLPSQSQSATSLRSFHPVVHARPRPCTRESARPPLALLSAL